MASPAVPVAVAAVALLQVMRGLAGPVDGPEAEAEAVGHR